MNKDEIKEFLKDEWFFFVSLLVFFVVMTYNVPYLIETGGGTIDLDDRIELTDAYETKGSFNLSYVSTLEATVSTFLASKVIPSWELIPMKSMSYSDSETYEDVVSRDRIYLDNANESAIKVAYEEAGKSFSITSYNLNIFYVDPQADTTLKVGDIIIKCNDKEINNQNELKTIINKSNVGDTLNFTVKRNNDEVNATGKIQELEGSKVIGISVIRKDEYVTDPEIKLTFKDTEAGPSGGFTLALAIYNKLVEEDITHGLKIVGTGTIEEDGTVGEIGGVEYKLKGAASSKADLFLVPAGSNYEDAIKYKEKHKLKIEIIPINNFKEAVEILKNYKGE